MPSISQKSTFDNTHLMRQWEQLIDELDAMGVRFVAIKRGTKLPTKKRWNETKNTINGIQAKKYLANGHNISIAAGTGNELKAYLYDFDREADRGHDNALLDGGYYTHRINAPDKTKYIYLSPDTIPTRLKSRSHGIDHLGLNSNGTHWQGVIAGIHDSGAPILLGGHTIPVLPADTASALWEEWTGHSLFAPVRDESETDTVYDADLAIVAEAFEYADPHDVEMDYGSWIGIIAAVHDAFGDEALDLVVEWAEGKPGEVESKWRTFDREYNGKGATLKSLFYFARRGGWVDPTPLAAPPPLPEGARVLDNGAIVLKTTPTPEPTPRPLPPVLTPTVVEKLGAVLRSPAAMAVVKRIKGARDLEMYRDVLIQLVTVIAPEKGSWVFDADARWLGEKLKKRGISASRNMWALDAAGILNYRHGGKAGEEERQAREGRPPMRIDLQPLVAELWESSSNVTNIPNPEFVTLGNDPPTNVYATYSGAGKYADASGRTPYTFAVRRLGYPTVLARPLTSSALTTLDYLSRAKEATRAELVEGAGMSPGAASGGTRCLAQLGIVSVEWDGPGTPKIYVLRPDWESRLRTMIPHMTSYGAHIRLVIHTYDERIEFIDWKLRQPMPATIADDLRQHKKKLESARKKWCAYGNKVGAYGRFVEANPPWQGRMAA